MSAIEPLHTLIEIKVSILTKEEKTLLEAELFVRACEELKEIFREQHRDYFRLMKYTVEEENIMLEENFSQLIIKDILSTGEYDLEGIARYINTFLDVVEEVMTGRNTDPAGSVLRKLIYLHLTVRRELYEMIIKKIIGQPPSATCK